MNEPLTVYTLPDCMQCAMTKRALDNTGLPYNVVDLTSDEKAADLVIQLGYMSAPVVVAGRASWSGFRPDQINAATSTRVAQPNSVPLDPMDLLAKEQHQ